MTCMQFGDSDAVLGRKQIRCVIKMEDELYAIRTDCFGKYDLIRCRWDPYAGFEPLEEEVPPHVLAVAEKITELHAMSDVRYPLEGEWYIVKKTPDDGRSGWRIRRFRAKSATSAICFSSFFEMLLFYIKFINLSISLRYLREMPKNRIYRAKVFCA